MSAPYARRGPGRGAWCYAIFAIRAAKNAWLGGAPPLVHSELRPGESRANGVIVGASGVADLVRLLPDGSRNMDLVYGLLVFAFGLAIFYYARSAIAKAPDDHPIWGGLFEVIAAIAMTGCFGVGTILVARFVGAAGPFASALAVAALIALIVAAWLLRRWWSRDSATPAV